MKLLFDQNLAPRLVDRLRDRYPGSAHVSDVGLAQASDLDVWRHAGAHGFLIVTKDADFNELGMLRGFPPKVVWVRRGNCSTATIEQMLRQNFEAIGDLERSQTAGVLIIT